MRVFHIPMYLMNPYQTQLMKSLVACGGEQIGIAQQKGRVPFAFLKYLQNREKPDIIHLHWIHPWIGNQITQRPIWQERGISVSKSLQFVSELVWLKYRGVKLVWTVHNMLGHECLFPRQELMFRRILAQLCDQLIVHSTAAKAALVDNYKISGDKIAVTPQGHFVDYYANHVDRQQARKQLGLNLDDRVIVFFGLIRRYKGVLELVEAFRALTYPEARLLIVGSCASNSLKQAIEVSSETDERIRLFLDRVPDDEVHIYLNAADAVVAPFRHVFHSSSIILAMSFARAVIVPRLETIRELVEGAGNILYDSETEGALQQALEMALKADLEAIGAENLSRAKQMDWGCMAKHTYSLYQELVQS